MIISNAKFHGNYTGFDKSIVYYMSMISPRSLKFRKIKKGKIISPYFYMYPLPHYISMYRVEWGVIEDRRGVYFIKLQTHVDNIAFVHHHKIASNVYLFTTKHEFNVTNCEWGEDD